jgi:hypothetical protein
MNAPKILVGLIVSVILISTARAQEQKPEIVWSNLQQKYRSFENLKPVIELRNVEHVLFDTYPRSNLMMRFDEKEEKWIAGNYFITDAIGQYTNLALKQNKPMELIFYWGQFFEGKPFPYSFFISKDKKQYPMRGKYKIRFYYGTELDKSVSYSDSPEFILEADTLEISGKEKVL